LKQQQQDEECRAVPHDVIPEDVILHSRRRQNLKTYTALTG
jgi:hypothetical protein